MNYKNYLVEEFLIDSPDKENIVQDGTPIIVPDARAVIGTVFGHKVMEDRVVYLIRASLIFTINDLLRLGIRLEQMYFYAEA
jgi:hypothetical protein